MPAAGEKFQKYSQIEWPRSDLVIKANINDSFEIDVSRIGVSDFNCVNLQYMVAFSVTSINTVCICKEKHNFKMIAGNLAVCRLSI